MATEWRRYGGRIRQQRNAWDPSGRTLTFGWTNLGTSGQPAWRITGVQGPAYSVGYEYFTDANSQNAANELFNLKAVHLDPSGLNRTTSFTYTGITGANGTESGLLSSVSDPLNHTVSYGYTISSITTSAWVQTVTEPSSGGNLIWTISASTTYGSVPIAVSATSNAGVNLGVAVDTQLRKA